MNWIRRFASGIALTGLSFFSLLASGEAEAISITFEKIVDTNTPIPGSTGKFEEFSTYGGPSLNNGNVAFSGYGPFEDIYDEDRYDGVYTNIGGKLNVVADENTPIPGGTGNFGDFGGPSLDNGNVAFSGHSGRYSYPAPPDYIQSGIYTNIGGKLNVVADESTPIPGGTGNFEDFSSASLDDGNVAFVGALNDDNISSDPQGTYTNIGGKLNVVADENTPIPGGKGNFGDFGGPSLDNGNVAFSGLKDPYNEIFSEQEGIYTNIGGKLNVVADLNTPIPEGTGNFTFFSGLSLNRGNVAFVGTEFDFETEFRQSGIYTNIGGKLNVVADLNTPIPEGTGNFTFFSGLSLDRGNVAFIGGNSGDFDGDGFPDQEGIYTDIGGTLLEVIATGDILDGKRVSRISFGGEGLSGKEIAFSAEFDDFSPTFDKGSKGIYIASVPEPASVLGTLAFGAFGTGSLLKRKLKKKQSVSHTKSVE